jgi:ketosteroid isomerase-like protein
MSLRKHMEIDMSPEANVRLVLEYFDGCNTGDIEQMKKTLADNVVHFFLPKVHPPIRGAEHLARYWRKFKEVYRPTWKIDRTLAFGNEVVSEWSCAYTLPSNGERKMFRGTEWYVIENGLIAEVRAYYQYDEDRDCELTGFPYADRGYLSK